MNIKKLYLIYFSPSGSTEKIINAIASEIEGLPVERIDLLTSATDRSTTHLGLMTSS